MHEIYHGIGVRVNSICDDRLGGVSDERFEVRQVQTRGHTGLPDVLAAIHT